MTMREFGVIHTAYWTDEKIATLSDTAKLLGAYLLTCPHSNAIGCFRLPLGYISEDLHWSHDKVRGALGELSNIGFICRDENSTWTLIRNFLAFNTIENPNVGKACMRLADAVPTSFPFFEQLISALEPHAHRLSAGYIDTLRARVAKCQAAPQRSGGNGSGNGSAEPFQNGSGNGSETVSERFGKPFRNPEPNLTKPEGSVASATGTVVPVVLSLKSELFGRCLVWLVEASGRPEKSLRPMVGRWVGKHGEGAVLAAIVAAQREAAVSPVGFIEAVLKSGGKRHGEANGSKHDKLVNGFARAFGDLLDPGSEASGGDCHQLAGCYH
jgi:hypothetical protein